MPLSRELLGQIEILHAIGDARLDHGSLEPFVEGGNGDPFGLARHGRVPAGSIGGTIVAGHNIGTSASRNTGVVIAGQDACRPDFAGAMRAVIGIDFGPEPLVDSGHVVVLDTPVASTEEVYAIEDAQQVCAHPFGRPDRLVVGIDLAANGGPLRQRAPVAQRVPEEQNGLALPVEEVGTATIVGDQIAQTVDDVVGAAQATGITFKIDA